MDEFLIRTSRDLDLDFESGYNGHRLLIDSYLHYNTEFDLNRTNFL